MSEVTKRLGNILAIHTAILIGIGFLSLFYFLFGLPTHSLLDPLCWLTLTLISWILFTWNRVTKQSFDLYTLFILSTVAFNCGQIILQVFGLNTEAGLLEGRFSSKTLFETVLYIDFALVAIHFGALLRLRGIKKIFPAGSLKDAPPELFQIGALLTILSIVPTLIVLKNLISVVQSSGYFGLYERSDLVGADNILTLISGLFVPGMLMLIAGSRKRPELRMGAEVGLILYALTFMLLGRRGDGGEVLISYALVRHYCIRPIPKKIILPAALVVIGVIFPLMAMIRNVDLNSRADLDVMVKAFESIDNPMATALSEMGGSMQSVSYTMELVPKYRPYDLGASYFYSAFSVFPNLFWSLHPSIARGSPSIWLVKTVDPGIARMGGGIGYSYIAETYLNFGWWAGPLLLVLIGYAVSALVRWSLFQADPAKIAIAASFFGNLITFARADSQSVIRPLVWYSLLPYLAILVLQKIHRSRLEAPSADKT